MPEADPTAGRTTEIPMSVPSLHINARVDKDHTSSVSGGLTVSRRQETDTSASSRMKFEQINLKASSLMGVTYATEELIQFSPISVIGLIEQGFSDEFAAKSLSEKIRGTGVSEPLGVLNSACTIEQAAEGGQSADTIEFENVVNMRSRCWGYATAIWIANHDTYPELATMKLDVGTGGSSVYTSSAVVDRPDLLLGRPIFYSEFASTLGNVGDLILGNWSQYIVGTLQGLRSASSVHVRFLEHEQTFKLWIMNDGKPWWTSALTPNQSTVTLSPFVTLAAR
jgi:HK97 family phage major capsid protein